MNPRTVDVTEARPDRSSPVEYNTTVTPVLEKNIGAPACRDDISATLNCESIFDFRLSHEITPLHSEYNSLVSKNDDLLNEEDIKTSSFIDDENGHRITLLARKYATKHMLPEDSARLDILTQRFRNAMPAITEKDLEIMEHLNERLDRSIELSNRLKEKYK